MLANTTGRPVLTFETSLTHANGWLELLIVMHVEFQFVLGCC